MDNRNIEMMKKIIEKKKQKSSIQTNNKKAQKSIGTTSKGFRIGNGGGLFD
ncbi:hypothetical protein [Clostridium cylindrosporum]|uniref:Uncharacterized protein n=1 Tax=Clostridium cylindrosporum DSM 605 TaxID=1121307 RepID=A0A0J8D5C4_CLOCY|nr:hypothetical protein [Clostridium cylindrosporum]KMT21012.1 hypothetical protein CLCY_1c02460 [Clostridium cylindrosporum DSM 605]